MKKLVLSLAAMCLVIAVGVIAAESSMKKTKLQHVVCFKFKASASSAEIKQVELAFLALKPAIPQISALEWGLNNSPEGLNKGFTHCFIVTFKSEADRDKYLPHPDHKKFVEVLKPTMEDAFVIDFWAQE